MIYWAWATCLTVAANDMMSTKCLTTCMNHAPWRLCIWRITQTELAHCCLSNRLGIRLEGPAPKWARTDGGEGGSHPSNVHDHVYALGTINFTGNHPVSEVPVAAEQTKMIIWSYVCNKPTKLLQRRFFPMPCSFCP